LSDIPVVALALTPFHHIEALHERPAGRFVEVPGKDKQSQPPFRHAPLTSRFWGHAQVSDWHVGSTRERIRVDGSEIADGTGVIVEADLPHRLTFSFDDPQGLTTPTSNQASSRSRSIPTATSSGSQSPTPDFRTTTFWAPSA
jgi:hypothetical protein